MAGHEIGTKATDDLEILFRYLEVVEISDQIFIDLSLARGLDYYTGIVYEVTLVEGEDMGSVAGGGRYDNLIGMFANKSIPSVGVAIGVERVLTLFEAKNTVRKSET
mmetsp:Transcript_11505/g.5780  ORF Transcript_11505/g.5780 Transcript_11505/m.5780 type:complete len:107 (+) Transcript_11505:241-561(+)|eukprot:CAMPEP_0201282152 /NCGR_PEP_ID=MMETSP1317-20130820/4944_1 /ASSEMBLY_ACC=CAM_ASM_000770 /TAXON_ID=187299 /ORGANISM="Undescribed Undescribed, Strain Undescribed" /LENGTH=106 /DNA_ID=CAMNT_0047594061 /DNA_START=239 /DNA_END=559 /DNA_ORIENTATION=+